MSSIASGSGHSPLSPSRSAGSSSSPKSSPIGSADSNRNLEMEAVIGDRRCVLNALCGQFGYKYEVRKKTMKGGRGPDQRRAHVCRECDHVDFGLPTSSLTLHYAVCKKGKDAAKIVRIFYKAGTRSQGKRIDDKTVYEALYLLPRGENEVYKDLVRKWCGGDCPLDILRAIMAPCYRNEADLEEHVLKVAKIIKGKGRTNIFEVPYTKGEELYKEDCIKAVQEKEEKKKENAARKALEQQSQSASVSPGSTVASTSTSNLQKILPAPFLSQLPQGGIQEVSGGSEREAKKRKFDGKAATLPGFGGPAPASPDIDITQALSASPAPYDPSSLDTRQRWGSAPENVCQRYELADHANPPIPHSSPFSASFGTAAGRQVGHHVNNQAGEPFQSQTYAPPESWHAGHHGPATPQRPAQERYQLPQVNQPQNQQSPQSWNARQLQQFQPYQQLQQQRLQQQRLQQQRLQRQRLQQQQFQQQQFQQQQFQQQQHQPQQLLQQSRLLQQQDPASGQYPPIPSSASWSVMSFDTAAGGQVRQHVYDQDQQNQGVYDERTVGRRLVDHPQEALMSYDDNQSLKSLGGAAIVLHAVMSQPHKLQLIADALGLQLQSRSLTPEDSIENGSCPLRVSCGGSTIFQLSKMALPILRAVIFGRTARIVLALGLLFVTWTRWALRRRLIRHKSLEKVLRIGTHLITVQALLIYWGGMRARAVVYDSVDQACWDVVKGFSWLLLKVVYVWVILSHLLALGVRRRRLQESWAESISHIVGTYQDGLYHNEVVRRQPLTPRHY